MRKISILFFLVIFYSTYSGGCEFINDKELICSVSKEKEKGKYIYGVAFASLSKNNLNFTKTIPASLDVYPRIIKLNKGVAVVYDNELKFYSPQKKLVYETILPQGISASRISPKTTYIAATTYYNKDPYLVMLKKSGQEYLEKYRIKGETYWGACFTKDEKYFAYVYRNKYENSQGRRFVNVIESETGKSIKHFSKDKLTDLSISPDSKFLAYGTEEGEVFFLKFKSWEKVKSFKIPSSGIVEKIIFSENSKYVALNIAGDIRVYSTENFELLRRELMMEHATDILWMPDNQRIMLLEGNEFLKMIDIKY